jgi:hypothetical protein
MRDRGIIKTRIILQSVLDGAGAFVTLQDSPVGGRRYPGSAIQTAGARMASVADATIQKIVPESPRVPRRSSGSLFRSVVDRPGKR